jgi:hypothetical protein
MAVAARSLPVIGLGHRALIRRQTVCRVRQPQVEFKISEGRSLLEATSQSRSWTGPGRGRC